MKERTKRRTNPRKHTETIRIETRFRNKCLENDENQAVGTRKTKKPREFLQKRRNFNKRRKPNQNKYENLPNGETQQQEQEPTRTRRQTRQKG